MGTLITTFKDKKFVNYGVNQGDWKTTLNGTLEVTGASTFKADVSLLDNDKLKIGGTSTSTGDLQIYHDGSNSYIEGGGLGSSSGSLIIRNRFASGDVIFQGDNGDGDGSQTTYFQLDNSIANTGNPDVYTRFPDNSRLTFGNSANANSLDLEIYHDSGSNIKAGSGGLNIESKGGLIFENDTSGDITVEQKRNDGEIDFKCDNGSNGTESYLKLNGSDVSVNILIQKVMMSNLPTSDPSVAGQLWNSSGTLKVSAG